MLLPNYDELVSLKNQTNPNGFGTTRKVSSNQHGGHTSLFKGRGLDFAEVREYASGDDIRAIDWRVTARVGRPHTKVFTEERERSVFIIVDINNYMEFGTRQTFKSIQTARAAALLAWRANHLHDKTGAILFGHIPERIKVLPARRSRKSIWEMLKILCTQSTSDDEVKIEEALIVANKCVPTGSQVFIISDFFKVTKEFENQFAILSRRCDISLVKVNDPADKNIPAADEIRFSDERGDELIVDTNDITSSEVYRQIWKESEAALKGIAQRFCAKIIELATDRGVSMDLFRGGDSLMTKCL